jgi:tetratricopeptide (TPR) repeat protein
MSRGFRRRKSVRAKETALRLYSGTLIPRIGLVLAISLLSGPGCSSRTATDPRYVPAGDLLDIVKDFQRLMKEDTYRFPIPKDVTGVNIMKATLVRLEDYEKKNPGKFTDIVQYNKALALERLREYDQAIAYYRKVPRSLKSFSASSKNRCPVRIHLNTLQPSMKKLRRGTSLFKNTADRPMSTSLASKKSASTAPRSLSWKPIAIASKRAIRSSF